MTITKDNYYEDTTLFTNSQRKDFKHCAFLYHVKYVSKEFVKGDVDAKHFIIGKAVDCLRTEPGNYDRDFSVGNLNKMTAEQKEASKSKDRLTAGDSEVVAGCVAELNRQPLGQFVEGECWETQSILTGEFQGVKIKGKLDYLNKDKKIIVDLKTTKDIVSFNPDMYAHQLAFYRLLAGEGYTCYMIVVDKKKKNRSSIYMFTDEALEMADTEIKDDIIAFSEARKVRIFTPATLTTNDETEREEIRKDKCFSCDHYSDCPHSKQKIITLI